MSEKSKIKETLLELEDVASELSRYFKDEEHADMIYATKYSLLLCLIYSELGNKRRAECRL